MSALGQLIGGVIGFFLYGPVGFAIGSSIGGIVTGGGTVEGQRIDDLRTAGASLGDDISKVYGTVRLPVQFIWTTGLVETRHSRDEGGLLGFGETTIITYTYKASVACLICEGVIQGVSKIWMNNKLVWDRNATGFSCDTSFFSDFSWIGYTGNETQTPDPTMVDTLGVGNVNANRGMAYIVIKDLELKQYYNKIPNIEVEVVKEALNESASERTVPPAILANFDVARYSEWGTADEGTVLQHDVSVAGLDSRYECDHIVWRTDFSNNLLSKLVFPIRRPTWAGASSWIVIKNNPWIVVRQSVAEPYTLTELFYRGALVETLNWANGVYDGPLGTPDGWAYSTRPANIIQRGSSLITTSDLSVPGWTSGGFIKYSLDSGIPSFSAVRSKTFERAFGSDFEAWPSCNIWPDMCDEGVFWYQQTGAAASPDPNYLVRLDTNFSVLQKWKSGTTGMPASTGWGGNLLFGTNDDGLGVMMGQSVHGGLIYAMYTFELVTDSTWTATPIVVDFGAGFLPLCCDVGMAGGELLTSNPIINTFVETDDAHKLENIVNELCLDAGYSASEIDVTGLTGYVDGFRIPTPATTTARDSIAELQKAFYFDGVEVDDKLTWIMRGGSVAATIPEADMAAHESGSEPPDLAPMERTSELEMPRTVVVNYLNANTDYEGDSQYARRLVTEATAEQVVRTNVIMDDDHAAQMAAILLYQAHQGIETFTISVSDKYQKLVPTDIITITVDGSTVDVRIVEIKQHQSGWIELTVVPEHTPIYTQTFSGTGSGQIFPHIIRINGPAELLYLDMPILTDIDDGYYSYAGAMPYLTTWGAHELWREDIGGNWNINGSFIERVTGGFSTDALADANPNALDMTSTVNVQITDSALTLTSSVEQTVILDELINRAVIGAPGRWEIIQFITATLEADGTYTLSGLLRGRRGTGYACNDHLLGDVFALIDNDKVHRITVAAADLDTAVNYRFFGRDNVLDNAPIESITYTGRTKLPFYPANVEAVLTAGDWVITWIPRTRLDADIYSRGTIAIVDDTELDSYTVDIVDSAGAVLRTTSVAAATETWTYTAAMQAADGSPANTTPIIIVYQKGVTLATEGHGLQWDTSTETETIVDPKA